MEAADPRITFGFQDADLDALLGADESILDPLAWLTDESSKGTPLSAFPDDGLSPANMLDGILPPLSRLDAAIDETDKKAEQKERIKAKNRRAQNKYREKQKMKMKETEQQVEEMGVELERLRLENARMQHQHDVLERVLHVRDYAVSMLEADRPVASKGAALPITQREPVVMTPVSSDKSGNLGNGSTCTSATNSGTDGCSGDLGDVCVFSEGGMCSTDPHFREHQQELRIERLKQMSPEEVQAQWRGIVQRLSDVMAANSHLDTMDGEDEHPAISSVLEEDVRPILSEASMVCFEHAIFNPTNVQLLLARALDDGTSGVSAEDKHRWVMVMAALHLRAEQRQQMAAFREVFMRRMCRVLKDRRAIFDKLGGLNAPEGLRAMRTTTEMWLKTHECTRDLEQNMHEEHVVEMEFLAAVMGRVLNNTQKAVAIVRSWPFFPDVYSICTAALAEEAVPLLEECCSNDSSR